MEFEIRRLCVAIGSATLFVLAPACSPGGSSSTTGIGGSPQEYEADPDHFVCRDDVTRPKGVSGVTARQLLRKKCRKKLGRDGAVAACKAAAVAEAMNACKKAKSGRRKACKRMRRPDVQRDLEQIREQVLDQLDLTDRFSGWAETVGERVLAESNGPCEMVDRRFLVYEDSDTQALALPGGPIVVSTGLMEAVDESELAFVLGHELGHVRQGSADLYILAKYMSDDSLLAELSDLVDIAASACRGPLEESYVDHHGAMYAIDAGYDPAAGPRVFSRVLVDDRPVTDLSWDHSHGPSKMRATTTWYTARWYMRNKTKTAVFFRGAEHQSIPWDLEIPAEVSDQCR